MHQLSRFFPAFFVASVNVFAQKSAIYTHELGDYDRAVSL
jgi:hypothetical protein